MIGGEGDDFLVGADRTTGARDGGSDWLIGGVGDDSIKGRGGEDFIEGGAGNDRMDGEEGSDTFIYRLGDGIDRLSDTGSGDNDHDTLEFGSGIEQDDLVIVARSSGEELSLFINGDTSGDRIDLRGNTFGQRSGIEEFAFAEGNFSRSDLLARVVFSKDAGLSVAGTSGDEDLAGGIHDDLLQGSLGSDALAGGFGSDVYVYELGDGDDIITENGFAADVDVIVFGNGIEAAGISASWSAASPHDITLSIGDGMGSVTLVGQSLSNGENSIEEIRFDDGTSWTLRDIYDLLPPIVSTGGADILEGRQQADRISGGDGNDRLTGGQGDDYLVGGDGSDTYVFNLGDGRDTILDDGFRDTDTIEFGTGITLADITASYIRDDLLLRIGTGDDQILIRSVYGEAYHRIETFRFADGTTLNFTQMMAQAQIASEGKDDIRGSDDAETLAGGAGDDRISGGDGNDRLTGGLGDDYLIGGDGSDTYVFNLGDGRDTILDDGFRDTDTIEFGTGITLADITASYIRDDLLLRIGTGDDQILIRSVYGEAYHRIETFRFADGTTLNFTQMMAQAQIASEGKDDIRGSDDAETLAGGAGDDRISGGDGNDRLTGGLGDDYLIGGDGSDTYVFNLGDGRDTILDDGFRDTDTIEFGTGITLADITASYIRDDLLLRIGTGDDQILIRSVYGEAYHRIETFRFADGTTLNFTQMMAQAQIASEGKDDIRGSDDAETLAGGAGDDRISGGDGNDRLTGGLGDDYLIGGDGSDTYVFNLGDGRDTILDDGFRDTDTIEFGTGITLADITASYIRDDLLLRIGTGDDQILIRSVSGEAYHRIEEFRFADGTVLNFTQMMATTGSSTGMQTTGTAGADVLNGGVNDDRLSGGSGSDRLIGGKGDDELFGGEHGDTYVFDRGDGRDVIYDDGYNGSDRIEFGAGISAEDVIVTQTSDGADLLLSIAGTTDELLIEAGNRSAGRFAIEEVMFEDGTVWSLADLRERTMQATAGEDRFHGTEDAETLIGVGGNDMLSGGSGSDRLIGGKGDDELFGGEHGDTYVFDRGDGRDVIYDDGYNGSDRIEFGAGISAEDVIVTQTSDGADLLLSIAGTTDELLIEAGNRSAGRFAIEEVMFEDGTVWSLADLRERTMQATAGEDRFHGTEDAETLIGVGGNDMLSGGSGSDRLIGGKGDDELFGGEHGDTYVFDRGDGRDVIYDDGYNGSDRIEFGAGISAEDVIVTQTSDGADLLLSIAGTTDELLIEAGNRSAGRFAIEEVMFEDGTVWSLADLRERTMQATAGEDRFHGTEDAETLIGVGGNDMLSGGSGSDRLIGGKGDDELFGGEHGDTYVFDRGDGRDVIYDDGYNGSDRIEFGAGISAEDVIVTQTSDGADLLLSIAGTTDELLIEAGNRSAGRFAIEEVVFEDGTVWSLADLKLLAAGTIIDGEIQPVTMGDDAVTGSRTDDIIRGMRGSDALRGGSGSDTYMFRRGDGHDTIYDPNDPTATDVLVLEDIESAEVRVLTSPADANDIVLVVDDDNLIYLDEQKAGPSTGVEEVRFADGVTWSRADLLSRAGLVATPDSDTLVGTNFADVIAGGYGDDTLEGRSGGDAYHYDVGDGHDTILEAGSEGALARGSVPGIADDRIIFGPGITAADIRADRLGGTSDVLLTFQGNEGSILLQGQVAGSQIGSGVEFAVFNDGITVSLESLLADSLQRAMTSGDDFIGGFATADQLSGGGGNDRLEGGRGSDVYRFNLGDGLDTVVENAGATGDVDEIVFGPDIAPADITFQRRRDNPDDLILVLAATGDEIALVNQLSDRKGEGVEVVRFADGSVWSREQLAELYRQQPATAGDDFLKGQDGVDETISGLEGDDYIEGGLGNDILDGGVGDDDLHGGAGDDVLRGGAGDDRLSGGAGQDAFDGGDGYDLIDFAYSLDGWVVDIAAGTARVMDGDDTAFEEAFINIEGVVGGVGRDTIIGDASANRLEGFEGDDVLSGGAGDDAFVYRGTETGFDQIEGGSGVDRLEASEDQTVIGLSAISDVEEISSNGFSDVVITGTEGSDTLDFSGIYLNGISLIFGAAGDDHITGSASSDIVDLGLGDDVYSFAGGLGADSVSGGEGWDSIQATSANVTIRLSKIDGIEVITANGFSGVTISGSANDDILSFAGVALNGIKVIDGGNGDDTLTGSNAADIIRGGQGNDNLAGGSGDDVFEFTSELDGLDVIDGGAGFDRIRATALGLTIRLGAPTVGVEAIEGMNSALVYGALDDIINMAGVSLTGITLIDAGAGDDRVFGTAGADTITGGAGDDTLSGNGGNDNYVYNIGTGNDTIVEAGSTGSGAGGIDTVFFGANIAPSDVSISTSGSDVILTIGATGETVTIRNQLSTSSVNWIEEVRFEDGTVWDRALLGPTIPSSAGDDVLGGSSADDIFQGGLGNDTLRGGSGNDTYVYASGDGSDFIDDESGSRTQIDTLRFVDLASDDVTFSRTGVDGQITINATGSIITIDDQFYNSDHWGVDRILFSDGQAWDRARIQQESWFRGTAGDDVLGGSSADDIFQGGLGNDTLRGGSGNDTYVYASGDGSDFIDDESGSRTQIDTLRFVDLASDDVTFWRLSWRL